MIDKESQRQKMLSKLGITALNKMQIEAIETIENYNNTLLLSKTGSGKTLAFVLPIIEKADPNLRSVQVLILVPSRELALQIEEVVRSLGSGHKIHAAYGGRPISIDKKELQTTPSILIGTPGRINHHLRIESFDVTHCQTLVLDEFDKSLEIGFEEDMRDIVDSLDLEKRILTSATHAVDVPSFVDFHNARVVDYHEESKGELTTTLVLCTQKDKLEPLVQLLHHLGPKPGIIFCNFRDSIDRVSDHLHENDVDHICFHGGMEQMDREQALIQFRNGSEQLLIATDLAARGIDIPEIEYIIHYHLPTRAEEWTHRNGRTARMHNNGSAYLLLWEKDHIPEFVEAEETTHIDKLTINENYTSNRQWKTLKISCGRRDKVSKGDIAGFLIKKGHLLKDEVGLIEVKPSMSYVAVSASKANGLQRSLNNERLKKSKARISLI